MKFDARWNLKSKEDITQALKSSIDKRFNTCHQNLINKKKEIFMF